VAFLTTRVKNPDKEDWGKLKRVLKYLNGTKFLKLKLSVDSLAMLKWYADRSHNIHVDCRGHGGGFLHSQSHTLRLGRLHMPLSGSVEIMPLHFMALDRL